MTPSTPTKNNPTQHLPTVKTEIQIRFADLDPLGHVSNNAYSEYFEVGRVHWLNAIQGERPSVVVAKLNIDFIKEVGLNDQLHVITACIKKGNKSLELSQNLYANGSCVTQSTVTIVGFDTHTRQSVELLKNWQTSINTLEA